MLNERCWPGVLIDMCQPYGWTLASSDSSQISPPGHRREGLTPPLGIDTLLLILYILLINHGSSGKYRLNKDNNISRQNVLFRRFER